MSDPSSFSPLFRAAKALCHEIVAGDSWEPTPDRSKEIVTAATPKESRHVGALGFTGYLAAAAVPMLGALFATILFARGQARHGAGVLLIAAVSWMFRLVLLAHGATA
jgi:hypothetical protein